MDPGCQFTAVHAHRPKSGLTHATVDKRTPPRLAECGAHSMDGLITMDGLMKEPCAQVQHATNDFCIAPRLAESGAHIMDSTSSCGIWRTQHGRFDHHGRFDERTLCTGSARNKRLLYSASSCGIWRSQHGQFIFKAFSNNCRTNAGVGVYHQHATNDFCIAPRLPESGAHSMDSTSSCGIWRSQPGRFDHHGRFDERTLCTGSARNKRLLYSASSCVIWRS